MNQKATSCKLLQQLKSLSITLITKKTNKKNPDKLAKSSGKPIRCFSLKTFAKKYLFKLTIYCQFSLFLFVKKYGNFGSGHRKESSQFNLNEFYLKSEFSRITFEYSDNTLKASNIFSHQILGTLDHKRLYFISFER